MTVTIMTGDCRELLKTLPDESVQCCVTSPPYFGLRDYGVDGQIGLEPTPAAFVAEMVAVFREVRRALRSDGVLWVNLGDSYSGSRKGVWNVLDERKAAVKETCRPSVNPIKVQTGLKPKDLIGIPWRVAFALQDDGWWLRQDIIWSKPNPMPESVIDRCTKAHEYLFMLTKSAKYYYDAASITEDAVSTDVKKFTDGGKDKQRGHGRRHSGFNGRYADKLAIEGVPATRNRRSVWQIATKPFSEAHFATFPPELPEICIKAGSREGDTVLDPFGGAGTTGLVADRLGRNAILCELNPEYAAMADQRITVDAPLFATPTVNPVQP